MTEYLTPKVKVITCHAETPILAATTTTTIPHGEPGDDDFPPKDINPQAKQNGFWEDDSDLEETVE